MEQLAALGIEPRD
jgi:gas vesicle protein